MLTTMRPSLDREMLRRRYLANRTRTADLLALLEPEAYYERPIDLRHPIVFYDGHLPAFSLNKLVLEALGKRSLDPELQRLFYRGIDPASQTEAERQSIAAWPDRDRVRAFTAACDAAVLDAFATADLTDADASPLLAQGEAAMTILEHEELHHETLMYMLYRLPYERKRAPLDVPSYVESAPAATGRVRIAAGTATLGTAVPDDGPFAWDNERGHHAVDVPSFEIDVNNVTNGDWLAYVRAGGPVPSFWRERDGAFTLLAMFEEISLPLTWPVYVSQTQAAAYAAWRGARLPTEAEYHRAAFGTPSGVERRFPWGDADPSHAHGNFDFQRFDPQSVGASPAGASAWGVHDLVGNGWEWTATPFAPFDGFAPMATYPEYSADFFDGEHYVVKGASPVTNRSHIRRGLRNWYRGDYPFVFATFRTVT